MAECTHVTLATRTRVTFFLTAPSWRGRLAAQLRRWACRLDNQWSVAVCFNTEPQIDATQQRACLDQAFEAAWDCAADETRALAVEQMMRKHCPELYAESARSS